MFVRVHEVLGQGLPKVNIQDCSVCGDLLRKPNFITCRYFGATATPLCRVAAFETLVIETRSILVVAQQRKRSRYRGDRPVPAWKLSGACLDLTPRGIYGSPSKASLLWQ